MPASKAQQKAVNKYMAANYDRINLTVTKGQREAIRTHAATQGESVNGFINRAITETMERDTLSGPQRGLTAHLEGGAVSLHSEAGREGQEARKTSKKGTAEKEGG